MTNDRYLEFCEWFVGQWGEMADRMQRELHELEEFKSGKRKSKYPLGSVFFTRRGEEMNTILKEMEYWDERYGN